MDKALVKGLVEEFILQSVDGQGLGEGSIGRIHPAVSGWTRPW